MDLNAWELAFDLYQQLLTKGKIEAHEREWMLAYDQQEEVRMFLDQMAKRSDVFIYKASDTIYLTPGIGNRFFSMNQDEMKQKLGLPTNENLYLAYLIIITLLAQFYNNDDGLEASRQFLLVEELEQILSDVIEEWSTQDDETLEQESLHYEINFPSIISAWKGLQVFNDQLRHIRKGKNRVSFILKVLTLLEDEELVQVQDNSQVRLLPKMHHLMSRYYFNKERKALLFQLLERGE